MAQAKKPDASPDASAPEEVTQSSPAQHKEPETETVYTRDDLMAAASAFGVTREAMAGALRAAEIGDEGTTKAEAEKAVKAFNEREV